MTTVELSTDGAGRYQLDKVWVAIIGVGNCASSFVQGVHYSRDADPAESGSYLMKSPMHQRPDSEARELTEAFIEKHARTRPATGSKRKSKAKS